MSNKGQNRGFHQKLNKNFLKSIIGTAVIQVLKCSHQKGLREDRNLENNAPLWESKQEEGKQQLQESKGKFSPFSKRILIVDDDPDVTFTFKKAF